MNALLKKELRLLLPGWLVALPLALLPPWFLLNAFFRHGHLPAAIETSFPIILIPMMLLAAASFGQEFSHGTFDSYLAQPVPRRRLFGTKCTALGIALTSLWAAAWVSAFAAVIASRGMESVPRSAGDVVELARELQSFLALSVAIVFAVFSIGLWSALLFRQTVLSFWAALAAHAVVLAVFTWVETLFKDALPLAAYVCVIALYGVAGLVVAWRLFKRVESVPPHWVNLEMPSFSSVRNADAPPPLRRKRRPLAALVRLELSLQFATLLGAGLLLLLVAGCAGIKTAGWIRQRSMMEVLSVLLEMFWFLIPLMAGACAVAEERRLGTWTQRLCLPVSRWKQFAVKFGIAIGLGLLVGASGLIVSEILGRLTGMSTLAGNLEAERSFVALMISDELWTRAAWLEMTGALLQARSFHLLLLLLSLGLVSFYASTLSRNTLQAVGLGLVVGAAGLLLLTSGPLLASRVWSEWDTPAIARFAWAFTWISWVLFVALSITLVALSARNCFNAQAGSQLLLRNLRTTITVSVVILIACGAVYFRAWELVMAEKPHGPPRIPEDGVPKLAAGWSRIFVLLPDGQLWISDKPAARSPNEDSHFFAEKGRFLPPSTWSGLAVNSQLALAIRSDGTLWSLMRMVPAPVPPEGGSSRVRRVIDNTPQQIGSETNWVAIASSVYRVMALKRDGSLWGWHSERHGEVPSIPTLRRIGEDSNWASLHGSKQLIIGVTRDGDAAQWRDGYDWRKLWSDVPEEFPWPDDLSGPDRLQRVPTAGWIGMLLTSEGVLHQFDWRMDRFVIRYPNRDGTVPAPRGSSWRDACTFVNRSWRDHHIAGITGDGRLWWNVGRKSNRFTRLGDHSDWLAVEEFEYYEPCLMSLARDGTLSFWLPFEHWHYLAPSRLPGASINIFDPPE